LSELLFACPRCASTNVIRRGATQSSQAEAYKNRNPRQRWACKDCNKWSVESKMARVEPEREGEPDLELDHESVRQLEAANGYIITAAQNNTELHEGFWRSVLRCAGINGYELIVPPTRYRNPTNQIEHEELEDEVWWPSDTMHYIADNEIHLSAGLWYMGNVRIAATAVNPLVGLHDLTKGASAVFGHAQAQMRCIPTPQNELPKMLYTSGSCSVKNYSETKAGTKGEFHHSLGAVIVEKDEQGHAHLRGVVASDDGSFHDLVWKYGPKGVDRVSGIPAIVTGDEHSRFNDPQVRAATYGPGGIVEQTRPERIVRHDVQDTYSVSHWHRRNTITRVVKRRTGMDDLLAELEATRQYIDNTTPEWASNIIVQSNHHEHITRWLNETDPRHDPNNLRLWCELMLAVERGAEMTDHGVEHPDPFALWCAPRLESATRFLERNESLVIEVVEVSLHGDQGPNGARGSAANLSKIGAKTVIGHSHTPCIEKGCYQVGTSSQLRLEYTSGPSSWMHTHCLIHPNGKRQLIHVVDGRWHGNPRL